MELPMPPEPQQELGNPTATLSPPRFYASPTAAQSTEKIYSRSRQVGRQQKPTVVIKIPKSNMAVSESVNPIIRLAKRTSVKLKRRAQSRPNWSRREEAHLIGLPMPVRIKILSYLLPDVSFIPAHHSNRRKRKSGDYLPLRNDRRPCSPAILRVCHQLYEEAIDHVYSKLAFELRISSAGMYFTTQYIPASFNNFAFKTPRAGEPWTAEQSKFLGLLWAFVYKSREIHIHGRGTRLDMFSSFISYARMSPNLRKLRLDLGFDERCKLETLLDELDTIRGLDDVKMLISSRTIAPTDHLQVVYINKIAANMMTADAPPARINRMSDWFSKFDATAKRADRTLWFDREAESKEARAAYRSGDLQSAATACEELQKRWDDLVRRVQEQYMLVTDEITELAKQIEDNQTWLIENDNDDGEENVVISRKQAINEDRSDSLLSSPARTHRHSFGFFSKHSS